MTTEHERALSRERNRRWRLANPERRRAQSASWYSRNKAQHAAAVKRYVVAHPVEAREKSKRWRLNNPERAKEVNKTGCHNRYARRKGKFVERVVPSVVFTRDGGICRICNEPVGPKWHIDHIKPLSRGGEHSYANVQLAHALCNMRKHASV